MTQVCPVSYRRNNTRLVTAVLTASTEGTVSGNSVSLPGNDWEIGASSVDFSLTFKGAVLLGIAGVLGLIARTYLRPINPLASLSPVSDRTLDSLIYREGVKGDGSCDTERCL